MISCRHYNVLTILLVAVAAPPHAPIKQRIVPLRTTAVFSAQSPDNRWSGPITFADGTAAYILSLEPELDHGHHPITVELTLRRVDDRTDDSNLLDPTAKLHGLQPYDFAADDLAEGPQKSAFGRVRKVSLKNLGLVIRITVLKAIVSPISGGHHQFDGLELQIEADNSNP